MIEFINNNVMKSQMNTKKKVEEIFSKRIPQIKVNNRSTL